MYGVVVSLLVEHDYFLGFLLNIPLVLPIRPNTRP